MSQLYWLDSSDIGFPPSHKALRDPDGLLAVGGDLSLERLVLAYSSGIFPWYSEGQPLLWWTPNPRLVLTPARLHFGRSLRKILRKHPFKITVDNAFEQVMNQCGTIERKNQDGSWITQEMIDAYLTLHDRGIAHSVEAWQDGQLVGGLYGVALGRAFFGESMFSLVSGASKVAFSSLAKQLQHWQFELIDCQIHTPYLASFGAEEISREAFEQRLSQTVTLKPATNSNDGMSAVTNGNLIHPIMHWSHHWQMSESGYNGSDET